MNAIPLRSHPTLCTALALGALLLVPSPSVRAQTQNYFGAAGAINGSAWSTAIGGPYTSAFNTTGGGVMNFQNVAAPNGGSVTVAGINATANVTWGSASGTISNQGNGVVPISVGSGATLDFGGSQSFTSSATAGYIKNGDGVLAMAGNSYQGGFTLNAGTMIVRGVNAMGSGAANVLTINGGVLAANSSRTLTAKYGGGIVIGGDFTFGATTGLASSSANLTFDNNVNLGATTRTLSIGGTGNYSFNGVVSGSAGLIVNGTQGGALGNGALVLGTGNSYLGKTQINTGGTIETSGESRFGTNPGSFVADQISFNGGIFKSTSASAVNFSSNRGITLNGSGGTFDVTGSTGTVTLTNVTTGGGTLTKKGAGALILAGDHTYTGGVAIQNGIVRLGHAGGLNATTPNAVSFGASASSSTKLQLNGFSVTVPSLSTDATPGAPAVENANATPATLTISNSGTSTYAGTLTDGTGGGALSLTKTGAGILVLAGDSSYTGTLTVNNGILRQGASSNIIPQGAGKGDVVVGASGIIELFGNGGEDINGLSGSGIVRNGGTANATLDVGNDNDTSTFNGVFTNGGTGLLSLTKSGTGALTLTSQNTHGGTTLLSGGTIRMAAGSLGSAGAPVSSPLGAGTVTLNGGGITSGDATARTILNPLRLHNASTLGDPAFNGTLTLAGPLVIAGANQPHVLTVESPVILQGTATSNQSLNGLTKAGNATLTVTGAADWSGNTSVSAGTFVFSGASSLNNSGPITVQSGASLVMNTTQQLRAPSLTAVAASTVDLVGGTLRVDALSVDATATFAWGASTITPRTNASSGSGSDVSAAFGSEVFQGRTIGVTGDLSTGTGSVLNLGDLYLSGTTLFNAIDITGTFNLLATGDVLELFASPYLLRGNSFAPADYGTLVLVNTTDGILGSFDTILAPGPDAQPFTAFTGVFSSASALTENTYHIQQTANQLLFHYRVTASIPEPEAAGLFAVGLGLLAWMRRRLIRS